MRKKDFSQYTYVQERRELRYQMRGKKQLPPDWYRCSPFSFQRVHWWMLIVKSVVENSTREEFYFGPKNPSYLQSNRLHKCRACIESSSSNKSPWRILSSVIWPNLGGERHYQSLAFSIISDYLPTQVKKSSNGTFPSFGNLICPGFESPFIPSHEIDEGKRQWKKVVFLLTLQPVKWFSLQQEISTSSMKFVTSWPNLRSRQQCYESKLLKFRMTK